MGTCKLCLKEAKLTKSHIIPKFLYKSMFGEDNHFLKVSKRKGKVKDQEGICEHLLCKTCETQISKYERYLSLVLRNDLDLKIQKNDKDLLIEKLDYTKFKLFQLSIIWRASLSQHDFFGDINLGVHEERIRQLLINEDPGEAKQYGCVLIGTMINGENINSLMINPEKIRDPDGLILYRFMFGGFWWLFYVNNHPPNKISTDHFISKDGILLIPFKELSDSKHFMHHATQVLNT